MKDENSFVGKIKKFDDSFEKKVQINKFSPRDLPQPTRQVRDPFFYNPLQDIIEQQETENDGENISGHMGNQFLDDSFGIKLEFSRLLQNQSGEQEIIEDIQDIDITQSLLKNL